MPRAQLTLEQRLVKYKITRERFDNESSTLLEAGFTNNQAERLIIRQSSSNTVKAVLTKYKTLLAQPYALNHQQVIIIAGHDGGSKNIEAVQAAFQALTGLGFNADQVVKIAGNIGGSKNIEAVQAAFQALTGLGFNADQVVKIAGHGGGSKNIEAVQAAFQALTGLGFHADQVVKIAGHGGGSKNIEAIQTHYQYLLAKGYNKEDLVSMVARNSGSRKVYGIVERNAAEDAASDFLYFLKTVLASPSTNNPSQNSLSAPRSTSLFFSQHAISSPAVNKRPEPDDGHADEEEADKHQDKRPNQGL